LSFTNFLERHQEKNNVDEINAAFTIRWCEFKHSQ